MEWGRKLTDKIRSMDSTRYVTNSINLMLSVKNRIAEMLMEVKKKSGNEACDTSCQPFAIEGKEHVHVLGDAKKVGSLKRQSGMRMI